MRDAMIQQRLVTVDAINPDVIYQNAQPVPKAFAKTITIGGVKHVIEAENEQVLLAKENAILHAAFAQPAAAVSEPLRDPNTGKFVAATETRLTEEQQQRALTAVELETKFKRGELSAKDYIAQSGAMEEFLADRGVPLATLQQMAGEKFTQGWAQATELFKQRHPEFPRTDSNRDLLGRLIAENNLIDSDPLEALEAAYKFATDKGLLGEDPATVSRKNYEAELAEAETPSQVEEINHKYFGGRTNGTMLFNR
jgi:hypothetical protein